MANNLFTSLTHAMSGNPHAHHLIHALIFAIVYKLDNWTLIILANFSLAQNVSCRTWIGAQLQPLEYIAHQFNQASKVKFFLTL